MKTIIISVILLLSLNANAIYEVRKNSTSVFEFLKQNIEL